MIKRLIQSYHHWIQNAYPCEPEQLGIYRIFYATIIIILVGIPQYADRIVRFPEGIFNPPPFFSLFFSGMPNLLYFQLTDIIILIGFFAVLVGLFTRTAGVLTALLIIINNGFIFSSGKIDHSFLVWFTLLLLSFSGWGKHFSLDSKYTTEGRSIVHNWTLSLLSIALGFGFFTAGLIKLVSGWLSLSDAMLRAFYLRNYYIQQKQDYLAPLFENFNFSPFWELGDWFTIIFEIGFLLVLFHPILFRFFTALAVFFHGLILLMMNIAFAHYLAIYLAFWVPLFSKSMITTCTKYYNYITRSRVSTVSFYGGILLFYLLLIWLPQEIQVWLRDGFLIIAFILVLFLFLFRSRILFATSFDTDQKDIIRFDGVCNLCNSFVQFVIKRDVDNIFQFKTLQSLEKASELYETVEVQTKSDILTQSSAFLSITRRLKGLWPYFYLTVLIPKPLRDLVYNWVARNRYKWFGKRDTCMIPSKELLDKFG